MSWQTAAEIVVGVIGVLVLTVLLLIDIWRGIFRRRAPKKDDSIWRKIIFG